LIGAVIGAIILLAAGVRRIQSNLRKRVLEESAGPRFVGYGSVVTMDVGLPDENYKFILGNTEKMQEVKSQIAAYLDSYLGPIRSLKLVGDDPTVRRAEAAQLAARSDRERLIEEFLVMYQQQGLPQWTPENRFGVDPNGLYVPVSETGGFYEPIHPEGDADEIPPRGKLEAGIYQYPMNRWILSTLMRRYIMRSSDGLWNYSEYLVLRYLELQRTGQDAREIWNQIRTEGDFFTDLLHNQADWTKELQESSTYNMPRRYEAIHNSENGFIIHAKLLDDWFRFNKLAGEEPLTLANREALDTAIAAWKADHTRVNGRAADIETQVFDEFLGDVRGYLKNQMHIRRWSLPYRRVGILFPYFSPIIGLVLLIWGLLHQAIEYPHKKSKTDNNRQIKWLVTFAIASAFTGFIGLVVYWAIIWDVHTLFAVFMVMPIAYALPSIFRSIKTLVEGKMAADIADRKDTQSHVYRSWSDLMPDFNRLLRGGKDRTGKVHDLGLMEESSRRERVYRQWQYALILKELYRKYRLDDEELGRYLKVGSETPWGRWVRGENSASEDILLADVLYFNPSLAAELEDAIPGALPIPPADDQAQEQMREFFGRFVRRDRGRMPKGLNEIDPINFMIATAGEPWLLRADGLFSVVNPRGEVVAPPLVQAAIGEGRFTYGAAWANLLDRLDQDPRLQGGNAREGIAWLHRIGQGLPASDHLDPSVKEPFIAVWNDFPMNDEEREIILGRLTDFMKARSANVRQTVEDAAQVVDVNGEYYDWFEKPNPAGQSRADYFRQRQAWVESHSRIVFKDEYFDARAGKIIKQLAVHVLTGAKLNRFNALLEHDPAWVMDALLRSSSEAELLERAKQQARIGKPEARSILKLLAELADGAASAVTQGELHLLDTINYRGVQIADVDRDALLELSYLREKIQSGVPIRAYFANGRFDQIRGAKYEQIQLGIQYFIPNGVIWLFDAAMSMEMDSVRETARMMEVMHDERSLAYLNAVHGDANELYSFNTAISAQGEDIHADLGERTSNVSTFARATLFSYEAVTRKSMFGGSPHVAEDSLGLMFLKAQGGRGRQYSAARVKQARVVSYNDTANIRNRYPQSATDLLRDYGFLNFLFNPNVPYEDRLDDAGSLSFYPSSIFDRATIISFVMAIFAFPPASAFPDLMMPSMIFAVIFAVLLLRFVLRASGVRNGRAWMYSTGFGALSWLLLNYLGTSSELLGVPLLALPFVFISLILAFEKTFLSIRYHAERWGTDRFRDLAAFIGWFVIVLVLRTIAFIPGGLLLFHIQRVRQFVLNPPDIKAGSASGLRRFLLTFPKMFMNYVSLIPQDYASGSVKGLRGFSIFTRAWRGAQLLRARFTEVFLRNRLLFQIGTFLVTATLFGLLTNPHAYAFMLGATFLATEVAFSIAPPYLNPNRDPNIGRAQAFYDASAASVYTFKYFAIDFYYSLLSWRWWGFPFTIYLNRDALADASLRRSGPDQIRKARIYRLANAFFALNPNNPPRTPIDINEPEAAFRMVAEQYSVYQNDPNNAVKGTSARTYMHAYYYDRIREMIEPALLSNTKVRMDTPAVISRWHARLPARIYRVTSKIGEYLPQWIRTPLIPEPGQPFFMKAIQNVLMLLSLASLIYMPHVLGIALSLMVLGVLILSAVLVPLGWWFIGYRLERYALLSGTGPAPKLLNEMEVLTKELNKASPGKITRENRALLQEKADQLLQQLGRLYPSVPLDEQRGAGLWKILTDPISLGQRTRRDIVADHRKDLRSALMNFLAKSPPQALTPEEVGPEGIEAYRMNFHWLLEDRPSQYGTAVAIRLNDLFLRAARLSSQPLNENGIKQWSEDLAQLDEILANANVSQKLDPASDKDVLEALDLLHREDLKNALTPGSHLQVNPLPIEKQGRRAPIPQGIPELELRAA
jgi:hypothetical protein